MGYSIQIKEAVLQKVFSGNKTHMEIAKDFGIGRSTIGKWLRDHKKDGNITLKSKEKRPKDWPPEERMAALLLTGNMSQEERASWCRTNGIFPHHLKQWRQDAVSGMTVKENKGASETEKQLKKEISLLKRDLSRKEKALAETAALLVLKKKPRRSGGIPRKIDFYGEQRKNFIFDYGCIQRRSKAAHSGQNAWTDNTHTSALGEKGYDG